MVKSFLKLLLLSLFGVFAMKVEATPHGSPVKKASPGHPPVTKSLKKKPRVLGFLNHGLQEKESAPVDNKEKEARNLIARIHPKNLPDYQKMGLTYLFENGYAGEGVTIAVIEAGFFYTIDPAYRDEVNKMELTYSSDFWHFYHFNQILPPLKFYSAYTSPLDDFMEVKRGTSVEFRFRHGDFVLSQLAEAAPKATILPVVASFGADGSFIEALEALSQRDDVRVINISRWLEAKPDDATRLNPKVINALRKCTDKGKVIVLSAGNVKRNIPSVPEDDVNEVLQDVSYFTANLISDLFNNFKSCDSLRRHVVVSGACGDVTSAKAGYGAAQRNYVVTEGKNYCSVFERFWQGTSSSAPYKTAILANLLSVRQNIRGDEAVEALFNGADEKPHKRSTFGRGLVNGKQSLEYLLN